jgi:hypothetical protein
MAQEVLQPNLLLTHSIGYTTRQSEVQVQMLRRFNTLVLVFQELFR